MPGINLFDRLFNVRIINGQRVIGTTEVSYKRFKEVVGGELEKFNKNGNLAIDGEKEVVPFRASGLPLTEFLQLDSNWVSYSHYYSNLFAALGGSDHLIGEGEPLQLATVIQKVADAKDDWLKCFRDPATIK